jgi:hypothetical protein
MFVRIEKPEIMITIRIAAKSNLRTLHPAKKFKKLPREKKKLTDSLNPPEIDTKRVIIIEANIDLKFPSKKGKNLTTL